MFYQNGVPGGVPRQNLGVANVVPDIQVLIFVMNFVRYYVYVGMLSI